MNAKNIEKKASSRKTFKETGKAFLNQNKTRLGGYSAVENRLSGGKTDQDTGKQKQDEPIGTGSVTVSSINVRSDAGANFPRIGGLTKGKTFQVYEEKGGWLKINYASGYGWISKNLTDYKTPEPVVEPDPEPEQPAFQQFQVKTTADVGLYVRNIPGNGGTPASGSQKLGLLSYGTIVTVLDEQNGWYKISYNGQDGWICGLYTEKYDPNASVAAVSTNGVPLYSQSDPRWGSRGLGTGGNTIKSAGCAMTSTAMCLSKIAGREIPPDELDQYLDTHGGYSGDLLIWARAAQYIGKTATSVSSYSQATVDDNLNAGRPVVISVKSGGHYVCVAGRNSDGSYIIHDPAGGKIKSGSYNGSVIKVEGYSTGPQLVYFH